MSGGHAVASSDSLQLTGPAGARPDIDDRRHEGGDGCVRLLMPADLQRLLSGPPQQRSRASEAVRRAFDVVVAGAALVALSPVMLLVALLVRITSPGPLLYGSRRLAPGGGEFRAWKFRSMFLDADQRLASLLASDPELRATYETYAKLPSDPRVTGVGRWIRLLSLDELPQLWNVVRGDMSLVGPRPKLPHEGPIYGDLFEVVCRVKPGLTGLWQVSGRSALTFDQRILLDVRYALTRTFRQDLVICLRTVRLVLVPDRSQAH